MASSKPRVRKVANPHTGDAGYVAGRPNPLVEMGWNVLYDGTEQGLDTTLGRWAIMCIAHGACVSHRNKREATKLLTTPAIWCESCCDITRTIEAERLLSVRSANQRPDEEQLRLWAKLAKGNATKCALFENIYGVKPDLFWD